MKEILHYEIRKNEGVTKLTPEIPNPNVFQNVIGKLRNWILVYLIFAGLVLPIHLLFYHDLLYPIMFRDSAIMLVVITTIIIYSSGISGTKQVVPGALLVHNKALINDINTARSRAFNVFGPLVGYVIAAMFYSLYLVASEY